MSHCYEHVNRTEREHIALMRARGVGDAAIGHCLGRDRTTVWRERRRNGQGADYRPGRAHERAMERRRKARRGKKLQGQMLESVCRDLARYWSAEQISGRRALGNEAPVAAMTIYRFLRESEGRAYRIYLRGPDKQRQHNRRVRERIHEQRMIDERPQEVETRDVPGHWEGDTVRGPMKSQPCVLTLVERSSQYLVARKLKERNARTLNDAAVTAMRKHSFKTLTVDHGMEFASHKKLEKRTGAEVYFAHKRSPWERGLNEQVNGLLRQFFPKGTDFSNVTPVQLARAERLLNERPRKSLGYRTPKEVLEKLDVALEKSP